MKKILFRQFMLLLLIWPTLFISCSDDKSDPEPEKPIVPNPEGFYLTGTNTVASALTELAARMQPALLDESKEPKIKSSPEALGKYVYIGANSTIQFTEVVNGETTVWGAENGGAVSNGTEIENTPINDQVIHGTLLKDGPAIKVAEEGLYYVFVHTGKDIFRIMRVEPRLIGDAFEGSWGVSYPLTQKSVSKTEAVYEVTDLKVTGGLGYKYMLNSGWHIYEEENKMVTANFLGVESYEEAMAAAQNDVGFFQSNIPSKESAKFTITLKYNLFTGKWTETLAKTGTWAADYSNTAIGLLGDGYMLSEEEQGAWDKPGFGVQTPVKNGDMFTWNWNGVTLVAGGSFVIIKDANWATSDGVHIFWNNNTTRAGNAFQNNQITNGAGTDENFIVEEGGSYDIKLEWHAVTQARTLTINKN